jgi:hypothetical protein
MATYDLEKKGSKMTQEERDRLMKEFMDKGGKIQKLRPGIAEGASSINKSKGLQWTYKDLLNQEKKDV